MTRSLLAAALASVFAALGICSSPVAARQETSGAPPAAAAATAPGPATPGAGAPAARGTHEASALAGRWRSFQAEGLPDLFSWTDTCNVYVLRDGQDCILIDLGDGSVLDRLGDIGVRRVEWVLFTHHHREQCQGAARLKSLGAKVAGPEAERALFEKPASFRKMKPALGDRFTVHGASYVRPPVEPIPLDRGFAGMDEFEWRGREFRCVQTRGNSPGAMTYFVQDAGRWLAFSGDVMLAGARWHNWFDSEWDYGFAAGIYALAEAASLVESYAPALLLPSHGPPVPEAKTQLQEFRQKLCDLERLLVRGYPVNRFAAAEQDLMSVPSVVPHVWQVSPHLVKFKGPGFSPNFALIMADSGRALAVDCGLANTTFLDKALRGMRERMGLKTIDAVIITHMHGDHIVQAPWLRENWGAQIWTLDCIADKFQHPERFDYAAAVNAYNAGFDSVRIDRVLRPGEKLQWEGLTLTADWLPGQTEFGLCLHGRIDGRLVAFTGDTLFGNAADPEQTGHEAVVARNSAVLEEGYIYAADFLRRLRPEVIVGGHSYVIGSPAPMLERFHRWALDMRAAFQALSGDDDYRYEFDPFWVRAEPYRVRLARGGSAEITLHVRNFRRREQAHRVAVHAPAGIAAEPTVLEGKLGPESRGAFPLRLRAVADAPAAVHIVAFDVTLDGHRYGEWFDCIVQIE